jgi:large subunit ribosomal protein L11e
MRKVMCDKLIINIAVGESGDRLTKAVRVLQQLSDQTPVESVARYTVRTFGIRRNEKIACHVTVRGEKATDLIERGLKITDYEISAKHFSASGNFGFGINEHIDLGLKYDPATGIYGMDFYVVLKRAGFNVPKKKAKRGRLGPSHAVTKEDAMEWVRQTFNAEIRR